MGAPEQGGLRGTADAAARDRAFVYPGAIHVAKAPAAMITIVGSCVAVCLRTPSGAHGGMVHFLMPHGPDRPTTRLGYANHAIPELIARVSEIAGVAGPLEASLAGGAKVRGAASGRRPHLGHDNVAAARQILAANGVELVSEAVGGCYGRRVVFEVPEGSLTVEELGAVADAE